MKIIIAIMALLANSSDTTAFFSVEILFSVKFNCTYIFSLRLMRLYYIENVCIATDTRSYLGFMLYGAVIRAIIELHSVAQPHGIGRSPWFTDALTN